MGSRSRSYTAGTRRPGHKSCAWNEAKHMGERAKQLDSIVEACFGRKDNMTEWIRQKLNQAI